MGGGEGRGEYHLWQHILIIIIIIMIQFIFAIRHLILSIQSESRMGKLISKGGDGQNLPYIPDNTLAQLTVKELNKKVMILMMMLMTMMVMVIMMRQRPEPSVCQGSRLEGQTIGGALDEVQSCSI